MIAFKTPDLTDRQWMGPLLAREESLSCDYTFSGVYLGHREVARQEDRLLIRTRAGLGWQYLYPAGTGPLLPALDALRADAAAEGGRLSLTRVTRKQRQTLEQECPGRFIFEPERDSFDYLYEVDRLASLSGKRFHAKRNHIHRFDEHFPDWLGEAISPGSRSECAAMALRWSARRRAEGDESQAVETEGVLEALDQMEALGLEGCLIRACGEVVAFALGGLITASCFDVKFERAFSELQGAYPAINREMARMVGSRHPQARWLNRESDFGAQGLRKAMLSYYPGQMVEKFTALEVPV